MDLLAWLDPDSGLLPPGRYATSLAELRSGFVLDERFAASGTRAGLWAEWEDHRALVDAVAGGVSRVWVSGSFVTGRLDPTDIDVTYFLDARQYEGLSPEDKAYLEECTEVAWCQAHGMRIDPYLLTLPEEQPVWRLTRGGFLPGAEGCYAGIGVHDELWQRCSEKDGFGPNPGTGPGRRRGYVEVLL